MESPYALPEAFPGVSSVMLAATPRISSSEIESAPMAREKRYDMDLTLYSIYTVYRRNRRHLACYLA